MLTLGQKGIDLKIGQTIRYKSKSMQHPEATYEGVVVGCYPYLYEILGKPIPSTMYENEDRKYDEPKPYKFCIAKYVDINQEQIYIVKDGLVSKIEAKIA